MQGVSESYLFDSLLEPFFIRDINESVDNRTITLVFPQRHHSADVVDNVRSSVKHALPDSTQVTQVENVMELGGGGQHLDLDLLPHLPGGWHKGVNQLTDILWEFTALRVKKKMYQLTETDQVDIVHLRHLILLEKIHDLSIMLAQIIKAIWNITNF